MPKGETQTDRIKAMFAASDNKEARIPLPDDKELPRLERQAGRQRIRTILRMTAWRLHLKVELKTTDTEIIATVIGEQ